MVLITHAYRQSQFGNSKSKQSGVMVARNSCAPYAQGSDPVESEGSQSGCHECFASPPRAPHKRADNFAGGCRFLQGHGGFVTKASSSTYPGRG